MTRRKGSGGQADPGIHSPNRFPDKEAVPTIFFRLMRAIGGKTGITKGQYKTEFHLRPPDINMTMWILIVSGGLLFCNYTVASCRFGTVKGVISYIYYYICR